MAPSRLERLGGGGAQDTVRQAVASGHARQDQVLVVGRLQSAGVGTAQDCVGRFQVVRNAEARLPQVVTGDPVVIIEARSQVHRQIAERNRVLRVKRLLFDVGVAVEGE